MSLRPTVYTGHPDAYLRECFTWAQDEHGKRLVRKRQYQTKGRAKIEARKWPGNKAYHCRICGDWHIGHPREDTMTDTTLDTLQIPAGTLVHIAGLPFEVPQGGAVLLGRAGNLALALTTLDTARDVYASRTGLAKGAVQDVPPAS